MHLIYAIGDHVLGWNTRSHLLGRLQLLRRHGQVVQGPLLADKLVSHFHTYQTLLGFSILINNWVLYEALGCCPAKDGGSKPGLLNI